MNDDVKLDQPAGAVAGETLEQVGAGTPESHPPASPPNASQPKADTASTGRSAFFVGAGILIPIILVYTGYSYWVFRGKVGREGYH